MIIVIITYKQLIVDEIVLFAAAAMPLPFITIFPDITGTDDEHLTFIQLAGNLSTATSTTTLQLLHSLPVPRR